MRNAAVAVLLFWIAGSALAKDISGHWTGTLKQGAGGTRPKFAFEMWLEQNGKDVTGRAKISVLSDPKYYGVMPIQGSFEEGRFRFRESRPIENHPEPGSTWCVKRSELQWSDDDGEALDGSWGAPGCSPGSIHLTRGEQQAASVCDDDRIVSEYDPTADDYHHYGGKGDEIATTICRVGPRCNRKLIFKLMLSQSRFIAPSGDSTPVTQCKTTRVNIGPSTSNYVRTTVDESLFSIVNYTLEGKHILHPGRVTRTIVERNGVVSVVTEGEGTGLLGPVNEFFSSNVWHGVDEKLRDAYKGSSSQ